jgi:MFS superfamily sulfate permease-like transporter
MRVPVLEGVLPVERSRVPADALAGLTLAAVGIPEVLGYAKIAGMPLVTGLYTLLLPMAAFAVLGSSRHLVVAADSATAAILAAALAGLAAVGSPEYVQLAGLAALLTAGMLLAARLARLGFLANFLSRTVLVGFLTGVGIQVAAGQLPDMLGVGAAGQSTLPKLVHTARALPHVHWADVAVSAGVIAIVLTARLIGRRLPGALLAVIVAIAVSQAADLARHGVAVIGPVPRGLPSLVLPAFGWHAAGALTGAAVSMFVVILAQSAATSRAYAAKYEEEFSEASDLTGLAAANAAAAFTGTFVVNGSPTKAQIVDSAGGRSQLSPLTAAAVVLVVLAVLTGPLAYLPVAALAAVVFLIAVELIDLAGMRRILAVRKHEFAVALLTAAAVVGLGVEYGIILAIVASMVDHLRHSYSPLNSVLVKSAEGHWRAVPVGPGVRTAEGLVVYRFGTSLYYANAIRLAQDVAALAGHGVPLRWLVLDWAAIGDVDYTASTLLAKAIEHLHQRHVRLMFSSVLGPVRHQLDRYGISADSYYDTPGEALEAFQGHTTLAAQFGHGPGEQVLDQEPLRAPVAVQGVEEADDRDHVAPRVVRGTGHALPRNGEALGDLGPHAQQVQPAVRHVGRSGPGAGAQPVDHAGHQAAAPQHVAGVVVAVQQYRGQIRGGAAADLDGPLPHLRVPRPAGRPVAVLPVGSEARERLVRRQRGAVDAGQQAGQPLQPVVQVRRPPVDPAGQPGHEQRGRPGLASVRVDGQQRRGGHVGRPGQPERPGLARGRLGFIRIGPHVTAQHRLVALPAGPPHGDQVHRRGHPAAQRPGRDHRTAQARRGPGQRLPRRPGPEPPPGLLVVAEAVRGRAVGHDPPFVRPACNAGR